jgi:hypothetical protein
MVVQERHAIQDSEFGPRNKAQNLRRRPAEAPGRRRRRQSRFPQETLELNGVSFSARNCNFGVASRVACFYIPPEAHESKSLVYVFWR